jgi:hypothetical protein
MVLLKIANCLSAQVPFFIISCTAGNFRLRNDLKVVSVGCFAEGKIAVLGNVTPSVFVKQLFENLLSAINLYVLMLTMVPVNATFFNYA